VEGVELYTLHCEASQVECPGGCSRALGHPPGQSTCEASQVDCGSSCWVSPQDARQCRKRCGGSADRRSSRAAKSGDAAAMAQLEQGQLQRDVCQLLKAGLAAYSSMPEAASLP